MALRITFRADSSQEMGGGHVMRCLTLAEEMRARGHECRFVCRDHPRNLIEYVREKGFAVSLLPIVSLKEEASDGPEGQASNRYSDWLGAGWRRDASDFAELLDDEQADWIVTDHYAIDYRWHEAMRHHTCRIMAIDDLADRRHDCDLLLDQTFGRDPKAYSALVPEECQIIVGAKYALLRSEFPEWRERSIARRKEPRLGNILISMGASDPRNFTNTLLAQISAMNLPPDFKITVVLGAQAPHLDSVRDRVEAMPWPVELIAGAKNMAELMASADLAIGAPGSTSWERCCLGLPGIVIPIADNQKLIAEQLVDAGATKLVEPKNIGKVRDLLQALLASPDDLKRMSEKALEICDGKGCERIANRLNISHVKS